MRYLLDTMVVSEPAKPRPSRSALAWLDGQHPWDLAVSVLTIGELQRGIARMTDSRRRHRLTTWVTTQLTSQFEDRILPVDLETALAWGDLTAEGDRQGRPLPVIDGLLLATARARGLTLVTRNVTHTAERGVPVVNPYRE